jgi:hypothetical protein
MLFPLLKAFVQFEEFRQCRPYYFPLSGFLPSCRLDVFDIIGELFKLPSYALRISATGIAGRLRADNSLLCHCLVTSCFLPSASS